MTSYITMSDTSRSPSATDYDNPNTQALSKKLNLSSEIDCRNLMLRDITALPVREPLAPNSIASPTQPPLMSCRDSGSNSVTRNNVWIARTVRTAMSSILSKP